VCVEETMDILMADCPSGVTTDFYRSYVGLILSVFYHVCRNLCELRHLVSVLLSFYFQCCSNVHLFLLVSVISGQLLPCVA
jgi:hypothetical protein